MEEIVEALSRDGSPFAEKALAVLTAKSARLESCLEREFAATAAVLRSQDFYEGVRAAVIDKDRNPQWHPGRLGDVTETQVAAFFQPSAHPLFSDTNEGGPRA